MIAIRGFLVGALVLLVFMMGCSKNEGGPGPGGGGTITVNGSVQDSYFNPVSGAVVIVSGKTPVTSAANGSFTVSGVSTPYDITVVVGTQKRAIVYQGLTRTDPVLFAIGIPLPAPKSATISGTVPGAPSATTIVLFVSGVKSWSATANPTTGAYTISATWYDSNTVYAGQLHVLRWTPNSGLPTAYDGYGNRALTITAGGTFNSGNDFTAGQLVDPAEQTISGSVVRPTGFSAVNYRQFY